MLPSRTLDCKAPRSRSPISHIWSSFLGTHSLRTMSGSRMTAPVLDTFHMVGSILARMLDIPSILAWLAACKDTQDISSPATEVLKYAMSFGYSRKVIIGRTLAFSRPLTFQRADEVLDMVKLLRAYEILGPPERHQALRCWYEMAGDMPFGTELHGTVWDHCMQLVDLWVWRHPSSCTIAGIEEQFNGLISLWDSKYRASCTPNRHHVASNLRRRTRPRHVVPLSRYYPKDYCLPSTT